MFQVTRTIWRRISSGPREKQAIAFLRIATGLFFLYIGQRNLEDAGFTQHFSSQLGQWAATNPFPFYQAFLLKLIVPNGPQLANFLIDAQILVGVSYLAGLFIPLSAPIAIFLSVNALLASQHMNPMALPLYLTLTGISLTLFWGRAGAHYGLDGLFSKRLPAARPTKPKRAIKRAKVSKTSSAPAKMPPQLKASPAPPPAPAKRSKTVESAVKKALNAPKPPKPKPAAPAPQPEPAEDGEPGFRKVLIHNHLLDDDDDEED